MVKLQDITKVLDDIIRPETTMIKIKRNGPVNGHTYLLKQYDDETVHFLSRKKKSIQSDELKRYIKYNFAPKFEVKHNTNTITGFSIQFDDKIVLYNGTNEISEETFNNETPIVFTVKYIPDTISSNGGKRRTRRGRSKKSRKSIRRR